MQSRSWDTRKLSVLAMFSVLAYLMVLSFRIPIVLFLSYEPKDVAIVIAGFLYGPMASLMISCVVSLVEMLTISADGFIGLVMNVITSCAFACTAAWVYQQRRTFQGAMMGLVAGILATTAAALLWNYLITPIYMGVPRQVVSELLIPYFLPFNLLKGGLNAAITMLVYKPAAQALRRTGLMPSQAASAQGKMRWGAMLVAGFVLISLVATAFVWINRQ